MTLTEETCVRQAERTASRTVEGTAVVIVIDHRKLHTLNPVGTAIWEMADGRTIGQIADAVVRRFEVERGRALEDAYRFVSELSRVGALEVGGDVVP